MSSYEFRDAREMLDELYMNIQRAGPVFTGNATLQQEGEGFRMTLQLAPGAFNNNDVGLRVQKALGTYVRACLKERGWRVKAASFKRTYFELFAAGSKSKAASNVSRNA